MIAKREFAGYWEYASPRRCSTAPAHPERSGAALLDDAGRLLGIGSLLVQESVGDNTVQGNMFVPVAPAQIPCIDDLAQVRKLGAKRRVLARHVHD